MFFSFLFISLFHIISFFIFSLPFFLLFFPTLFIISWSSRSSPRAPVPSKAHQSSPGPPPSAPLDLIADRSTHALELAAGHHLRVAARHLLNLQLPSRRSRLHHLPAPPRSAPDLAYTPRRRLPPAAAVTPWIFKE